MKILFVVDDFSGGAGNVIQILANEFSRRTYEVAVLLLNHHTDRNRLNKKVVVIKKNISSETSRNRVIWLMQTIKEVKGIIIGLEPNVVISFIDNNNALVGLSLMFADIPLIVSERTNPIMNKTTGIWRLIKVPAYFRADAIIVQCSNFVDFNRFFSRKTSVIPNPILKPTLIKNHLSKGEKIKIISVGRLSKIKQFDLMIKAFANLHEQFPDMELHIYGEGKERNSLEKLIKDLSLENEVFLPGKTDEVYAVLRSSDLYLMTSKQEGFPNALSEAMAVGLPVVVFECHEGLQDIIDHGRNGFLVPPNNIDELIKYTRLLLNNKDLRLDFSENAKELSDKFSVVKVMTMWEDMVIKVSEGHR